MTRPNDIVSHHQSNWEALGIILPTQTPAYILMACESLALRDLLRSQIEKRFSGFDHLLQDYSQLRIQGLVSTLSEQLPAGALSGETSNFIIHLYYLENSLFMDRFEGDQYLPQTLSDEASALSQAFPFYTIIWLDIHSLDYLQTHAPDFCEQAVDIFSWWLDEPAEEESTYRSLETFYRQLADPNFEQKTQSSLEIAAIYESHHSYQQAMVHYQRVLEYMQVENAEAPLAETYCGMGRIMMQAQDYFQATDRFRLALDSVDGEDHTQLGDIYRYMGICLHHSGNKQMSLSYFRTSNESYSKAGDLEALGLNHQDMAVVYHQSGEAAQALAQLEKAESYAKQLENERWAIELGKKHEAYQPVKPSPTPQIEYPTPPKKNEKNKKRMGRRAFFEKFIKKKG